MIHEREYIEGVTDKLQTTLSNISVELFPDRPDNYILRHPIGAVLVSGASDSMSNPSGNQQVGVLRFDVIVITRTLNNKDVGMYDVCRDVVKAVESFTFGMYRPFHTYRTAPLFNIDRWERTLNFSTPELHLQGVFE